MVREGLSHLYWGHLLTPAASPGLLPAASPHSSCPPSTERPYFKLHPFPCLFASPAPSGTLPPSRGTSARGVSKPLKYRFSYNALGAWEGAWGSTYHREGSAWAPSSTATSEAQCASLSCNRTPRFCLNQGFFLRVRRPSSPKVR